MNYPLAGCDIEMKNNSRIAIMLAIVGWLLVLGVASAGEVAVSVVAKRADDKVEITSRDDTTTVSVRSPAGISSAIITRTNQRWPKRLVLRLHLRGLEGLKVSSGKMELVAEASGPDNKKFLHVMLNQQAVSKVTESEIRAVDQHGQPAKDTPLMNGYFEVRLPPELFATSPESITIKWIDFYR